MTFSNLCNEIFWKSTTDYHVTDSVDAPMNNPRSEEHTSELQSHSEISYAVFCLKKKKKKQ